MSCGIKCVKNLQEEPKKTPYKEPKGSEHVVHSARDSVVGIGTMLHAERSRGRIPTGRRNCSVLPKNVETLSGLTQPPIQLVPGLSSGVKRPGREVDHSPLFTSVRRLRMSGAILLFPLYAFKTCTRTTLPLLSVVLDGEVCIFNL